MKGNKKILTVSIAAYNVESTLEECLIPFTKSRYKDELEILIINDGSKDQTVEIAKRYVREYPNTFFLVNKDNGGWGSTLNSGMQHGTGKYFKQLDGDDYFSNENLDRFVEFLKLTNADMVYSPFVLFTDKNGAILRIAGNYQNTVPVNTLMHFDEIPDFVPAMHSLCVKTEILKEHSIQITEHCFYTDVEFVLKCCNFCQTLIFFSLPVYYYRLARSGQSMSIQGVRKHYRDHLKMLWTMLRYEKENIISSWAKETFHKRLLLACEFQYIFFFALEGTEKERQELIQFDNNLQENYPKYYSEIGNGAVKLLRKFHYHGYKWIGKIQTNRDKRKKINVFEGC